MKVLLYLLCSIALLLPLPAQQAEEVFASYFDIQTGSAAGTEVFGKLNLRRNKDAHDVPVPAEYSFTIASDPSGLFEITNQRDGESRLFGVLKVKAGKTVPAAAAEFALTVQLRAGDATLTETQIVIAATPEPLQSRLLTISAAQCLRIDRLFDRRRPLDAEVLELITQVESNNGRFVSADPNAPLDFYSRPMADYEGTANQPNNLSDQWQRVISNLGAMGFAYVNTNSRYSTSYGPNGSAANRQRLKLALYSALEAFVDRVPMDPDAVMYGGNPAGSDYADSVFTGNEKGLYSHTDLSHQWVWMDGMTGPVVWLMPGILEEIRAGNADAKRLHDKLLTYYQMAFGAVRSSYRNLDWPNWGNMKPDGVGYSDGAFTDGNLGHRVRVWSALPAIWADYNRPITYLPYWYDGYTWPGTNPAAVTGLNWQYKPGWSPRGVIDDLAFWANHWMPDTHFYINTGIQPDGTFSHHTQTNVQRRAINDLTMLPYGESSSANTLLLEVLKESPVALANEAYDRIGEQFLHAHNRMIFRGEFDFITTGISYLADLTGEGKDLAKSIDFLLENRQAGTQLARLDDLESLRDDLDSGFHQVSGTFPYWVNNYLVHRKGGAAGSDNSYFFSLKMGSDMTNGTDSANTFHMASGFLQSRVDNSEYNLDVRRRFDWRVLPGVTEEWRRDAMPTGIEVKQTTGSNFAGMTSDGKTGLAAMRYRPDVDSTYASANADKAWFFPGDFAVAMGSGVIRRENRPGDGQEIITTLDQCQWRTDLSYSMNGQAPVTTAPAASLSEDFTLTAPSWVHQGKIGYLIFPRGNQPLYLRGGNAVLDSNPTDTSPARLLHLAVGHGVNPVGSGLGEYLYLVIPNVTAAEMPGLLTEHSGNLEIIQNGNGVQGIRTTGNQEIIQLVFHNAGTATLAGGREITVDRPALVQLRQNGDEWEVAASDPTHDFAATELKITTKNLPLRSGSHAVAYPDLFGRAGEPVTTLQGADGETVIRVPLPDVTNAADLDYQEQLYANVPIHFSVAANQPLGVTDDSATTAEDTPISIPVLANDGAAGLTVRRLGAPAHGGVTLSGNSVIYTPTADFSGTDSFIYEAADAAGNSAAATVSVSVTPVNDAPQLSNAMLLPAILGLPYQADLAAWVEDPDAGDSHAFQRVDGPEWLQISAAGMLSGTPGGQPGTVAVQLRVTDAGGLSVDAAVPLVVEDQDSDGDGLMNSLELAQGTNPQNRDSDGDGASDGYEFQRQTDPIDAAEKPNSHLAAHWDFNALDSAQANLTRDRIGAVPGVFTAGTTNSASSLSADGTGRSGAAGDRALALDGTGQRLTVTETAFLNGAAQDNDLTISFWQKLAAVTNNSSFWASSPTATSDRGLQAHSPFSSRIYFDNAGVTSPNQRVSVAFPVATDWTAWNHLAFVKNGNTAQIWLNGSLLGNSSGNTQALLTDFSKLTLGATSTGGSPVNGLLDDFAVYHTALSANEIGILAQGGNPDQFPSPEAAWIQRYFGPQPVDPTETAADADPDQDGYNNLIERALGGNPVQPNPAASLMTWQVTPGSEPPALQLEIRPGPDSGDLNISAEASTDLQIWSATNIQRLITPEGRLRFLDSQSGPRRFLRLRVSR